MNLIATSLGSTGSPVRLCVEAAWASRVERLKRRVSVSRAERQRLPDLADGMVVLVLRVMVLDALRCMSRRPRGHQGGKGGQKRKERCGAHGGSASSDGSM